MRKFLILIAIVALGLALLLLAARVLIGDVTGTPKTMIVKSDFQAIRSALHSYKINAGHYPSTEQGLQALVDRTTIPPFPEDWVKIADRIPKDPWRNEYRYRCFPEGSPHPFELISNGPDGVEGTKDDRSLSDRSHPISKP